MPNNANEREYAEGVYPRVSRLKYSDNKMRKQNRAFAPAHSICRKAYEEGVNAERIDMACPEKALGGGEIPAAYAEGVYPRVSSQNHENNFCQLKNCFVSGGSYAE